MSPCVSKVAISLKSLSLEKMRSSGIYEISPAVTITMLPYRTRRGLPGRTTSEVAQGPHSWRMVTNILQESRKNSSFGCHLSSILHSWRGRYHPGRYVYKSGLDVLTAVATAGGFSYRASRDLGPYPTFGATTFGKSIRWRHLCSIEPGDLIRIPEKVLLDDSQWKCVA